MDPLKQLLQKAHEGNETARAQLFAVAYDELRARAHAQLRGGGRNTLLDTTVLVHESYMRYVNAGHLSNAERGHFFSYAAHVMRSVIVDYIGGQLRAWALAANTCFAALLALACLYATLRVAFT